jgi:hypothetical protein
MKRIWLEKQTVVFVLSCTGVLRAEAWTKSEFFLVVRSLEQYVCAPDANRPSPAVVLLDGAEVP